MEGTVSTLLTSVIFQELGFEAASSTNMAQILKMIYPKGGTAFRDSLLNGCLRMIKLYDLLQKTGTASNWNFAQVILTDGQDVHSKSTLQETLQTMAYMNQKLNVKVLKIILIGVGVSGKAQNQLKMIAMAGGQNAEYYSVGNADIETIFSRITVNLGLLKRQQVLGIANQTGTALLIQQKVSPIVSLQLQHFAVLMNLDVSSSMQGPKWRSVCQSVDKFINFLGKGDLIATMVFNHEFKMLSILNSNDDLFKRPQPQQRPSSSVVVKSQKSNSDDDDCQIY